MYSGFKIKAAYFQSQGFTNYGLSTGSQREEISSKQHFSYTKFSDMIYNIPIIFGINGTKINSKKTA